MSTKADPPYKSELVDISSTDHAFTIDVTAIYVGATGGNVVAKLKGDTAAKTWPVPPYFYLLGEFESVTKTGTTAGTLHGVKGGGTYPS